MFKTGINNLARLIRLYAFFLLIALTIASAVIVIALMRSYSNDVMQSRKVSISRVSDVIDSRQQATRNNGVRLVSSEKKIDNLSHAFANSSSDYLEYALNHPTDEGFFYLPLQVQSLMRNDEEIKEIILNPAGDRKYFRTDGRTGNYLTYKKGTPVKNGQFALTANLFDPNTYRLVATYYQIYSSANLDSRLRQLANSYQQQVVVFASNGREIYHFASKNVTVTEQQTVRKKIRKGVEGGSNLLAHNLRGYDYNATKMTTGGNNNEFIIVALNDRRSLFLSNLQRVWGVLLGWLLVSVILVGLLRLTFRRYRAQLGQIISAMGRIGDQELGSRVPVTAQDGELNTLSRGINAMLDQIQQYVQEIYQAKIDQQEANIRALQAQINPHFLYNTLEYIRMSALSEGQLELADVIYNFSALMRHNITQDTNSTLSDEVNFVEKYIYLYQMRFPKQVAYQVTIPKSLATLKMPKFTLQPLVENYFVHGIDFSRSDNAIRVQAYREDERTVVIELVNNGESLPQKKLAQINERLCLPMARPAPLDEKIRSIGLQNVIDRVRNYYGGESELFLFNNEYQGVTVRLSLRSNQ